MLTEGFNLSIYAQVFFEKIFLFLEGKCLFMERVGKNWLLFNGLGTLSQVNWWANLVRCLLRLRGMGLQYGAMLDLVRGGAEPPPLNLDGMVVT
jgi:hypothetical protein